MKDINFEEDMMMGQGGFWNGELGDMVKIQSEYRKSHKVPHLD